MSKKVSTELAAFLLVSVPILVAIAINPFKANPYPWRYLLAIGGQIVICAFSAFLAISRAIKLSLDSAFGRAFLAISLGIASWGLGSLVWLYYNLMANVEIPYPSLADLGFVLLIPCVLLGTVWLVIGLKPKYTPVTIAKLVGIPIAVFVFSYYFFVQDKLVEKIPLLVKVLNVTYPVGDAIFLSLALVVLSIVSKSALYKPIFILCLGFIIEAFADTGFSWTISAGTYTVGCWVDFLFALAFFTIGLGVYYAKDIYERT